MLHVPTHVLLMSLLMSIFGWMIPPYLVESQEETPRSTINSEQTLLIYSGGWPQTLPWRHYVPTISQPMLIFQTLNAPEIDHPAPTPSDDPYRAMRIGYKQVTPLQSYRLPAAFFCLTLISIGSLVGSFLCKRYFDSISPE